MKTWKSKAFQQESDPEICSSDEAYIQEGPGGEVWLSGRVFQETFTCPREPCILEPLCSKGPHLFKQPRRPSAPCCEAHPEAQGLRAQLAVASHPRRFLFRKGVGCLPARGTLSCHALFASLGLGSPYRALAPGSKS